jgi:hypothetical protein
MGARKDNLLLNGFCSFSNLIYIWAYSKEVIYGLHLGNDRPCEPKKNGASVIYLFKKIVLMFKCCFILISFLFIKASLTKYEFLKSLF